jgi:hypothetical protein
MMTPKLHQEIARQRQAERLRVAERERLAAQLARDRDGVVLALSRRIRRLVLGRAEEPKAPQPVS